MKKKADENENMRAEGPASDKSARLNADGRAAGVRAMWKKNDRFTVKIEDLTEDGAGIGRLDGFVWFIKDVVIGDVVEARVMKTKSSYGFARLERVIRPSEKRVEPACPVARQCGGCQLQAMSYEEGLRFKENKVFNDLRRIGGFTRLRRVEEVGDTAGRAPEEENARTAAQADRQNERNAQDGQDGRNAQDGQDRQNAQDAIPFYPIIGMERPWRYRNKAQIPFGSGKNGEIVTGFYAGRTHAIIEHDDCLLGVEENRRILSVIKDYMRENHIRPYDEESRQGLVRHALIRKGFRTGQLMVCLVINGRKLPAPDRLVSALCKLKGMTSISFCVHTEPTNVILGREIIDLYGPGYITDRIGGIRYRISPQSFYQVNPLQTEKLYGTVLEYADLTGTETVWDLYCGIGTISLFLARKAGRVCGVEAEPRAVADARENARLNGLTNVEFFEGRAEEVLPLRYEQDHIRADVIVVDPPRKGCGRACLETIVKMAPRRVVYVSCDPATLARDLKYLCGEGYELKKVQCCDMFAWTGHVEVATVLSRVR